MMRILLFTILGLLLIACKKPENRRCVKTAGEDAEIVHMVDSFDKLDIGPNFKVLLVQDTVEKVIVRGGENLINFIQLDVTDGKLTIVNDNTCNFLRSYKHVVEVEIHLINVINIVFKGTKELSCLNQLNLPYLTFVIEEGAGQCNLDLNCYSLYLGSAFGWGNYSVKGQTTFLKIELRDNGFANLYGLQILNSATVISASSERMYINLGGASVQVETSSYGDIWYIGTPTFLEYYQYGEGELIDKN